MEANDSLLSIELDHLRERCTRADKNPSSHQSLANIRLLRRALSHLARDAQSAASPDGTINPPRDLAERERWEQKRNPKMLRVTHLAMAYRERLLTELPEEVRASFTQQDRVVKLIDTHTTTEK